MSFNLKSIQKGVVVTPPRLLIFGPHGTGKTTFASEAPNPILLPTEDGRGRLDIASFPIAKTYADVCEAIGTLLNEDHDYQTLAIDSIDWLEPIIWAEACRRNGWADIETPGYGRGYIAAVDVWRELFNGLVALRESKGMQLILIAHTDIKVFNDPANEPYDRYLVKLQPRAAALVQEFCDAVFFINFRTSTTKTDKGFKKFVTRGVGHGERVAYTEERPSHYAKSRYDMPAEISLPKGGSYAAIAKHIFPTNA